MTTNWTMTRVLRDRDAGLYLTSVVVSAFGTSSLWLASGVWVKDLTGSNGLAALCMLAMWAPTLAGPALGTIADRVRRKPLLIWTNLGLAGLLLTLFGVGSRDDLWLLFTVLFVYGATVVVHDPAESALLAAVVGPELLGDLNGLRMTATEGMKLVAPLTGAGLYAAYGGPTVACLDAVTFVLAAVLWALIRVRDERPAGTWRAQTVEGARHLWGHPRLRPLVLAGGTTMFFAALSGTTTYAVVDGLGHSPPTRVCCTRSRAPARWPWGWSPGPRCAGSASAGSRRAGSRSWRLRWPRGRSRPTRWPWRPARRSAWGCRVC